MFLCRAVFMFVRRLKMLYTLLLGRPVHYHTNLASLGGIQPHCNYCTKTNHSHFHHVLIYTAERIGASWRERKYPNGRKGDSNPSSLDREPGFEPDSRLRARHSTAELHTNPGKGVAGSITGYTVPAPSCWAFRSAAYLCRHVTITSSNPTSRNASL